MTDENFLEVCPLYTLLLIFSRFAQSKNIALQGTHCVGGAGAGLVIQVGDNTVLYVYIFALLLLGICSRAI